MTATSQHQQPTPERFFNAINAYEQTEAIKAAVELEIFTAIAEGNTTAATIAKRCEAAERGVRTLCDFLTIHGFLNKEGAQYVLAPDSGDRSITPYMRTRDSIHRKRSPFFGPERFTYEPEKNRY